MFEYFHQVAGFYERGIDSLGFKRDVNFLIISGTDNLRKKI
jgi:hypothetical protein